MLHENEKFNSGFSWWSNIDRLKQNGSILEAKGHIHFNSKWDLFLRRGAGFTQIQHFKINQPYRFDLPMDFPDFMLSYISHTK